MFMVADLTDRKKCLRKQFFKRSKT